MIWFRVTLLTLFACGAGAGVFLFSPDPLSEVVRDAVGNRLNHHFDEMYLRARRGQATSADRFTLRVVYGGMVAGGRLAYPEAASILGHYLEGRTDDLILSADYFRRSPVVRRALRTKACGRIGPVGLRTNEDPRLAYALNPFFIEVRCEHGQRQIDVWQRIEFAPLDGRGRVNTTFRIGRLALRLDDSLVHVFDAEGGCRPFLVHSRWSESMGESGL
jgi:hypothetical protein